MDELAYYKLVDPIEWETEYNMKVDKINHYGLGNCTINDFIKYPHRFDILWFSGNIKISGIENFLMNVPCIYICDINALNALEMINIFSWLLDSSSTLLNLKIAAPRVFDNNRIHLVYILKSNYKVYINTFSVYGSNIDKWFVDTVDECNARNVRGWRLVYSTVICLLCIAKYRLVRTGWIHILPIIARLIHSARYEPVFYI